jgi:hypothetical protein
VTVRERCTFCNRPATEQHHVAGFDHCKWFRVPLCTQHHKMITRAYYSANPNMMERATNLNDRIKRAREGCYVFLWLLDHPEQIDPESILK